MGSLDTGIIGPVLPSIEQSFNLTSRESSWIFTLFIIAFMIGSPVMAKFSDFYQISERILRPLLGRRGSITFKLKNRDEQFETMKANQ